MSSLQPVARGADQMVTASELVRQFGRWQDRAQRAPVYILHRGRPRLVLTSLDLMDALCTPHGGGEAASQRRLEALLDGLREAAVVLDGDGRIVAAGRAARAGFGVVAGDPATALAPGDPFLAAALDRVAAARVAETIVLLRHEREHECALEPFTGGVAVFLRDVTAAQVQHRLAATAAALDEAARADGAVATARIGLRGYLEAPEPALCSMTGVNAEALARARFVALLSVDSRVAVGDAIEAAIAGRATALDATLLVNRGAALPIRVALAPIRGLRAVEAVAAVLRARA